ncbi:hypothetical protein, partial [Vibrio parahaemolyticus]|uniref:hypothetical protein n=1 Tax=Vibrio parahaemolyticus TaxID=670 RepID=UPI0019D35595
YVCLSFLDQNCLAHFFAKIGNETASSGRVSVRIGSECAKCGRRNLAEKTMFYLLLSDFK